VITGFGEAKLHVVLRALQSVTEIRNHPVFDDADDDEPNGTNIQLVKLSHRSFHDFLTDRARSGPYFIDKSFLVVEFSVVSWNSLRYPSKSSKGAEGDITQFDAIES
jgi:hypothetical protein